jgi:hypothetical protein
MPNLHFAEILLKTTGKASDFYPPRQFLFKPPELYHLYPLVSRAHFNPNHNGGHCFIGHLA